MNADKLLAFRQTAYACLGRAHDAMFELGDAVWSSSRVNSFAELSGSPLFRRQWSSLYEALQDSRPQRRKLMRLYIGQMSQTERPVLASDHTIWVCPFAVTLQERTYEHQAAMLGNCPVGVGQGWSTLAWIPEVGSSWALPLRHERAISLWDSEYGCAQFVLATADIDCDKLMRLRSNRCLWTAPPIYGGRGRPRVHGDKFKLNDSTTWHSPDQQSEVNDSKQGRLRLRCWHQMHFRSAAKHPLQLILVEWLDHFGNRRSDKPVWLIWVGETMPPLDQIWQLYCRRFGVDHWFRFAKQRLHWTLPHLGTAKQAERWSDLMPLLSWQLWLARDLVADCPLPWQKSQTRLTPGRVAQSMAAVFTQLGTPAQPPKLRGKSPEWTQGQPRNPRVRAPIVKKRYSKRKKQARAST
ncbi:hypothetical protein NDA01_31565 [Trichocoleus desertorum AS-A10]|uniref:transposase n=1 Tax=Trichocoleus desertorum TaxID=1481672 RepID=UPI00329790F5